MRAYQEDRGGGGGQHDNTLSGKKAKNAYPDAWQPSWEGILGAMESI